MYLHNADNDNTDNEDAKAVAIPQVFLENSLAKNHQLVKTNFNIHKVKLYLDFTQKSSVNHKSLQNSYFYQPLKKK